MILYGASGHAKVILDCLKSQGKAVTCFIDDNPDKLEFLGLKVKRSDNIPVDDEIILSIGDNRIRKKIANLISIKFGVAIHSSAIVASNVEIGEGSVVFHGAILQPEVQVSKHCIINTGVKIDHECKIKDFVHIAPGSILCGDVTIGEGSFVGAGAVIKQCISIGKNVIRGAGAVVLDHVPDNCTVVGNPAKIIKTNT